MRIWKSGTKVVRKDVLIATTQAGYAWPQATRDAFLAAIDAGFEVTNFLRTGTTAAPRWYYVLTRQN